MAGGVIVSKGFSGSGTVQVSGGFTPGPSVAEALPVPGARAGAFKFSSSVAIRLRAIQGLTKKGIFGPDDTYYFQCPPLNEFSIDQANDYNDYMTINRGEFSRHTGVKLRTFSFDTIVTAGEYPFQSGGRSAAAKNFQVDNYISQLRAMLDSGTPAAFLLSRATNGSDDISMTVTMRGLKVTEKTGEPGDFYVSCSFAEYRSPLLDRTARHAPPRQKWPKRVVLHADGSATGLDAAATPLTIRSIALYGYRNTNPDTIKLVANLTKLKNWGPSKPIIDNPRYKKHGGTIILPDPGVAKNLIHQADIDYQRYEGAI